MVPNAIWIQASSGRISEKTAWNVAKPQRRLNCKQHSCLWVWWHHTGMADHDKNISVFLQMAKVVNLKLNKRKLRLKLPSVMYMGHQLTTERLHPDLDKIATILNMQTPYVVKSLQLLLGFVNYLSKFLLYLLDVCESLRHLLDKDVEWTWLPEQDAALNNIKRSIHTSPCPQILWPQWRSHSSVWCQWDRPWGSPL